MSEWTGTTGDTEMTRILRGIALSMAPWIFVASAYAKMLDHQRAKLTGFAFKVETYGENSHTRIWLKSTSKTLSRT
jgi:hypothetical protein